MTMQRQDYLRVSGEIRAIREALERSTFTQGERLAIDTALRQLAHNLAGRFSAVNPRFHTEDFIADAVGDATPEGRSSQ